MHMVYTRSRKSVLHSPSKAQITMKILPDLQYKYRKTLDDLNTAKLSVIQKGPFKLFQQCWMGILN